MQQAIRVRAGVALVEDGKILLVPHRNKNNSGIKWYLPGGGTDYGERLEDAAVREALEETGLRVEITHLFDVSESILPDVPWHSITVTFAARIVEGRLAAENHRTFGELMPQWFDPSELPEVVDYLRSTVQKALIAPRA